LVHEQAVDHYPTPSPHRPKGASAITPFALNREPRLRARLFYFLNRMSANPNYERT
jgi:hypothetical protein